MQQGCWLRPLLSQVKAAWKKHSILSYVRNNHYHVSFLVTGVLGVPLWTVLPCASGPTTKWGSRKMDFVLTSDCRGDIRWSSDSKIKRESTRKWGQVRWFSAVSRLICCILWPSGCYYYYYYYFFFKGDTASCCASGPAVGNTWDIPWCQMTSMLQSSSKRLALVSKGPNGMNLVRVPSLVYIDATGWGPSVMFVGL